MRPGQGPTSANPLRMCTVTLVLCGGKSPSSCLPLERLSGCCTSLRAPPRRLLRRHPQCTPSSSPQEGGDLKETGVTRAFAQALPPPSFPPSSHWPPSRPPPHSPCYVPMSSQSQQHRPFLPRSRRLGKVSFPFLPGEPVATILSPLLGRLAPAELGESASSPAAPLASFCKPRTALQDEKWEDSR